MAGSVIFFVTLISYTVVLARDCIDEERIKSCDECFRCGGTWCYSTEKPRCVFTMTDVSCSAGKEDIVSIKRFSRDDPNSPVNPIFSEGTAPVGTTDGRIAIKYKSSNELTPKFEIVNTTQNFQVNVNAGKTKCTSDDICRIYVDVVPRTDFCTPTSTMMEFIEVKMNLPTIKEDIRLKYHVPCACNCSSYEEKNSKRCNGRGHYQCGICTCKDGWSGDFCEKEICNPGRGDIPICTDDSDCNGNGICHCGQCACFEDQEGSQYYDHTCTDICTVTAVCDSCLLRHDDPCEDCYNPIEFKPYNKSLLFQRDVLNRRVWVQCNVTVADCVVQYAAMKVQDKLTVMVIDSCDPQAAAVGGVMRITVPAILGVIALVAAAAAVAGYMFWKNRDPPLPLNDPQYQNMNADFSQGENPLYKCPTSSFKNPTYGKWDR